MVKILTFKKRKDFLRVAKGVHVATHNMVLQATPCLLETSDIYTGYTTTKKIGNAVIRNKCRRRLRAIAKALLPKIGKSHVDYVFIARNSTAFCPFEELVQDTQYAIKKINKNFLLDGEDYVQADKE